MDKNKIDKAVARKLKIYGYSAEDLTEEEMKELREECGAKRFSDLKPNTTAPLDETEPGEKPSSY